MVDQDDPVVLIAYVSSNLPEFSNNTSISSESPGHSSIESFDRLIVDLRQLKTLVVIFVESFLLLFIDLAVISN